MRGMKGKYFVIHIYVSLADNFVIDIALSNLYRETKVSLSTAACARQTESQCEF